QGPVSAFDATAGTMTILGGTLATSVTTSASTEFRVSSNSSDTSVTKDAFFAQVKANVTVVKVRWRPSNAAIADQAEIQLGK
ncbi:MAG: hypothetical protein WC560_13065, partial [Syntrophales bacterium]